MMGICFSNPRRLLESSRGSEVAFRLIHPERQVLCRRSVDLASCSSLMKRNAEFAVKRE